MKAFVYTGLPARVIFGAGSLAQLPAELDRLGAKRALLLSTPEQKNSLQEVSKALGSRCAGTYDKAAMHVPVEVAQDARRVAAELGADCCVTVGGGSTTGLGKAIALTSTLPILAVPTTYAGSEMTPIYGLTEGGMKKTGRDARVLPKTVIYDPQLTLSPAAGAVRLERHERDRALRRGALRGRRQPDHLADGGGGDPGAGALRCRRSFRMERSGGAEAMPSTAPGSPASRSAPPAWRCITSCATCSAASACRTRRRTHRASARHEIQRRGRSRGNAQRCAGH